MLQHIILNFVCLFSYIKVLFNINDKFGGDIVLNNLEVLKDSQVKVSQWTNRAAVIFNRHLPMGGAVHPCQTLMADTSQVRDRRLVLSRYGHYL